MRAIFKANWPTYYFTLGRGKPSQTIERLWFTHHGRVRGWFKVLAVECNVGQFPPLRRIDGGVSEWQIQRDRWVAICEPPFHWQQGVPVFMDSFRGWHYFNFDEYVQSPEAKIAI
jgi:hypothetical protein